MDSCPSKDISYQSGTQTSMYEGKESALGMTEKQMQSRESHKFSEMLVALHVSQKLCQSGVLIRTPYLSGNCTTHSEEVQGWKSRELDHIHPGYTNWSCYFMDLIFKEIDKLNKVEAQQMSMSHWIWGVKLSLVVKMLLTSDKTVSYIGMGYIQVERHSEHRYMELGNAESPEMKHRPFK